MVDLSLNPRPPHADSRIPFGIRIAALRSKEQKKLRKAIKMDIDRWLQIKESIMSKCPVEEEGNEDVMINTGEGPVKSGTAEFLIVTTPMGRIKLACEKKPMVLDKKFVYSHRAGQSARTEYEFSDTEFTYKLKAYKWNDMEDVWEEIDAEHFA